MEFWSTPRRGVEDSRSRLEIIQERVGEECSSDWCRLDLHSRRCFKSDSNWCSMIAIGQELIIDPDWVEKVKQGKESEIETKLKKDAQSRLVVPEPLWQVIVNTPGWFPIED